MNFRNWVEIGLSILTVGSLVACSAEQPTTVQVGVDRLSNGDGTMTPVLFIYDAKNPTNMDQTYLVVANGVEAYFTVMADGTFDNAVIMNDIDGVFGSELSVLHNGQECIRQSAIDSSMKRLEEEGKPVFICQ